jgi:hypothetical protein
MQFGQISSDAASGASKEGIVNSIISHNCGEQPQIGVGELVAHEKRRL